MIILHYKSNGFNYFGTSLQNCTKLMWKNDLTHISYIRKGISKCDFVYGYKFKQLLGPFELFVSPTYVCAPFNCIVCNILHKHNKQTNFIIFLKIKILIF
jgi:hypothetical protein